MAIFPSLLFCVAYSSFCISLYPLSNVHVWVRLSRIDTCPISPYLEWLGVVVKTEEYGPVKCRVLNGSNDNFPFVLAVILSSVFLFIDLDILDLFSKLFLYRFCPFFQEGLGYASD